MNPFARKGKESVNWKGDNIGYRAIHYWVRVERGNPTKCSNCDVSKEEGFKIEWANKSGKYKRDLSDWMSLCKYCHHHYDHRGKLPTFD